MKNWWRYRARFSMRISKTCCWRNHRLLRSRSREQMPKGQVPSLKKLVEVNCQGGLATAYTDKLLIWKITWMRKCKNRDNNNHRRCAPNSLKCPPGLLIFLRQLQTHDSPTSPSSKSGSRRVRWENWILRNLQDRWATQQSQWNRGTSSRQWQNQQGRIKMRCFDQYHQVHQISRKYLVHSVQKNWKSSQFVGLWTLLQVYWAMMRRRQRTRSTKQWQGLVLYKVKSFWCW